MTREHRESYTRLLELLEDEGYLIVEEEFSSDDQDPDFNADLWLVPPPEDEQ